ncbi:SCO2523 family variant P-loop protein [Nocardia sp. NBC_01730]|uniref:SCO2523 family variant P-loop protein n=1 Tax=Nocardia sp. NBC_01730 TaxID=2975998 RepID=UPI002E0D41B1|nr:SCO2523 family variant P-loop protein [Nocardia sp. NBC_01730]
MIVFATSDKGGTGRSVTSCNLAYRLCLSGMSVVYLDFDFGSPTAGALFEIGSVERGTPDGDGLHEYLLGKNGIARQIDVRARTDRSGLRKMRTRTGRLVLFPGDEGGAEFDSINDGVVKRCTELLVGLEQEFKVCFVDLSAGRSLAMELVLRATAAPQLASKTVRWLVFHRWTRQHILAASGLVHGPHGLLETGGQWKHDPKKLLANIRYVRTAVPQLNEMTGGPGAAQVKWLQEQNGALVTLAGKNRLGATSLLGKTPVEPVLQWREQIILDADVANSIANEDTAAAFNQLAGRLVHAATWE